MKSDLFSMGPEINLILGSTTVELDGLIKKLNADAKITDQELSLIVDTLTRREHALTTRLEIVLTQNADCRISEPLTKKLLEEILFLSNDRPTRSKVEQIAGQQAAFYKILDRFDNTVKSERYRIKVDKSESGSGDHKK